MYLLNYLGFCILKHGTCLYKQVPTSSKKLYVFQNFSRLLTTFQSFFFNRLSEIFYIFIKNSIPTTIQYLKPLRYSVLLWISCFYGHATVIMNCLPYVHLLTLFQFPLLSFILSAEDHALQNGTLCAACGVYVYLSVI